MVPLLPELKIALENDHLVLHGSPAESAGCVLRGVVSLKAPEVCKLKTLRLKFKGLMHIEWKEGTFSFLSALTSVLYKQLKLPGAIFFFFTPQGLKVIKKILKKRELSLNTRGHFWRQVISNTQ